MVCCTGNAVVWCENCWAVVVRCGMYKHIAPHHIIPPHFTLHHSTSNTVSDIIPNHTTFHVSPSFLTITDAHFISHQHLYSVVQYHISNRTVSATLCITPHLALHPISHYIPHNATFHVLHGTFQITPYIGHIMHCTTFSRQHCTAFHMPLHILHNCIIPPHLTVITPSFTSHMFHITFHITHQYTTTFYIPPLITSRITPPPRRSPHSRYHIPHHTMTFHIPYHGTHTNP